MLKEVNFHDHSVTVRFVKKDVMANKLADLFHFATTGYYSLLAVTYEFGQTKKRKYGCFQKFLFFIRLDRHIRFRAGCNF